MREPSQQEQRVLTTIAGIPEGFVATYGDCSPGAPRLAGAVLRYTDRPLPWWRVVRADGSLTQGSRQHALLDAEGVPFKGARVDLSIARYFPEDSP